MDLHSFTAKNAEEAIRKVRDALGPDAVIEKVVKVPPGGMARLWQGPLIQVHARAGASQADAPISPVPTTYARVESEVQKRGKMDIPSNSGSEPRASNESGSDLETVDPEWAVVEFLQATGMLPQYAMEVVERIQRRFGASPSVDVARQRQMVRLVLEESWRPYIDKSGGDGVIHVFAGPPGSGKSSAMCKWLTHHRLVKNGKVRAFQLNTQKPHLNSDQLALHCDILGIPLERYCPETRRPAEKGEAWFVDLPGDNHHDPTNLLATRNLLAEFDRPEIHLVLNIAYESPIFLGQMMPIIKAGVSVSSLIFTHLDEEPRWGKLWNAVFAASLPVSNFSVGQNIPGDFMRADSEWVIRQQFPS